MYMSLYWYRWTGQSGQAKLGYTTYESGKSTTLHSVFDPAFPETPALVYGLNHLDSTEVKPDLIWQLNPGSLLSPTMLGCWLELHSWYRRTQLYLIINKVFLLLKMFSLTNPHNQEKFEDTKGVIRSRK